MNMTLYRVTYFFKEAIKNIRHSIMLTSVSVLTIATSLILVGFFGGLLWAAGDLVDKVAKDIRVSAYLELDVTPEQVSELTRAIEAREGVEMVAYISLEEDRIRNQGSLGELSESLLAGLDEASIPASPTLEIALERKRRLRRDVEDLAAWVKQLRGVGAVSEVEMGMDKIRLGLAFVSVFRTLAWAICVVLLIAAVFFVFSTIKMAVHARSDEIEVLRLVGATPLFIRVPFYIEGLLQGLAGSILAFIVVMYLHGQLDSYIREEQLFDVSLDLVPAAMIVWFFVGGILLGFLGSVTSVGRYLKN